MYVLIEQFQAPPPPESYPRGDLKLVLFKLLHVNIIGQDMFTIQLLCC